MKAISAKEFHDRSSHWIRSNEALVVTRHGKDVLGIYYPLKSPEMPREAEWDMCKALAAQFGKQLKRRGISEEDILDRVEEWRDETKTTRR